MTYLTPNSSKTRITCGTVAAMISTILFAAVVLGMTGQAEPRIDTLGAGLLAQNQVQADR